MAKEIATSPRKCTECGEQKDLSEFYRRTNPDTYVAKCKACMRTREAARYWEDPEHHRAKAKARYWEDPEGNRAENRAQWVKHHEARTEYGARYRAEHGAEQNAKRRQQRLDDPEKWRARDRARSKLTGRDRKALLTRHGLTAESFSELLVSQNGGCAICGGGPNGKGTFHIDHDHVTGRVRGLLCHYCNTALGSFCDEVPRLQAAIAYLQKHLPGA